MSTSRPALARHASSHASAASLTSNDDGDKQYDPSPYLNIDEHADDGALVPVLAELTFYVVPAKLDLASMRARIEELGGRVVGDKAEARIVVTALKGRPRLERVLGSGASTMSNLLSSTFITDAYDLANAAPRGTIPHLPNRAGYRVLRSSGERASRDPSVEIIEPPGEEARQVKRARLGIDRDAVSGTVASTSFTAPTSYPPPKPDMTPYPTDIRLKDIPRLCVERPSPLDCVNQDIIDAIKPIYLEREFDEHGQKNSNILSYRRSMSVLKCAVQFAVPRRIKSGTEARKLVDVGDKVAQRIDEYLSTGIVAESASIVSSPRYKAMTEFASIYTIGQATAAELWDRRGCRTVEDVRRWYVGKDGADPEAQVGRKEERAKRKRRAEGTMRQSEIVEDWLRMKDDLDAPIPRDEVLEIEACVMEHVHALLPGCEDTVCGGYRRGKLTTSDVDVIFTPGAGDEGQDKGMIKALCSRLFRLGIVTHVLHRTTRDPTNPLHSNPSNFDNLDKAFVILRLPRHTPTSRTRLHRRVDLICAPRERYAAATLSWSGSMMFERDLRRYAEDKGYKFRAGVIDRNTNVEINLPTERDIFDFLGLAYVPPELRNADG